MTDDIGRDLLVRGIAAAKANSLDEARSFLEKFLRMRPPLETRVQAWRYLAEIAANPAEKRDYLGRILTFDPTDGLARRALAVLDGRLDPADIVNPNRAASTSAGGREASGTPAETAPAERLTCPQCGSGRLVASADGATLVCEHCGFTQAITTTDGTVDDHDFAATMWTAKGHRREERVLTWRCESCGAGFLIAPGLQSLTCPFCNSVHVGTADTPRDLIPPEAMVPFEVSVDTARAALRAALNGTPFSGPSAVYLPAWMFTFAGAATWRGFEREGEGFESYRVEISGDFTLLDEHTVVSATSLLPDVVAHVVDEFNPGSFIPYDSRRTAGTPAATYSITLDGASIGARRKVVERLRKSVADEVNSGRSLDDLEIRFGRLGIDTFKLLLLPFWVAQVSHESERRLIFVNGQSGTLAETAREGGLISWLTGLFGS